jgi:hypothetical protein
MTSFMPHFQLYVVTPQTSVLKRDRTLPQAPTQFWRYWLFQLFGHWNILAQNREIALGFFGDVRPLPVCLFENFA